MKNIEVSDAVHAALQRLALGFRETPDAVLARLLNLPSPDGSSAEPIVAFVLSAEFRSKFTDADKYVSLLAWLAARHEADFRDFIQGLKSGRRYLGLSREEVLSACRHNQARPIEGTPYWAIMNLDTATKRRFLARVMEFTGYPDETIEVVCAAIGMRRQNRRRFVAALF